MPHFCPLARLMAQRKITQQGLADSIGVSRSAVQRWLSQERPAAGKLHALSQYFGVSIGFLLGDETETADDGCSPSGDILLVKALKVGPNDKPSAMHQMLVDALWLQSIYPSKNPEKLALYTVYSDDMAPTLHSGDLLLVDPADKNPDAGLFVVVLNNATCVRRLQLMPTRQVRVICDDPHYDRLTVNPGSGAMQVLGRVVFSWNGRR